MKGFKGTKGKWEAELDKALYFKIKVEPDLYIEISDSEMTESGVLEANTKLIENAPRLLKALQMVMAQFNDLNNSLYGQNISVVGYHLNGDHEPFDTFIENSDEGGLEFAEKVLSEILD